MTGTLAAIEQLAVDADGAAKIYGLSKRHFLRSVKRQAIPQPVRFGRSCRWNVHLLREHLAMMQPTSEPRNVG